MLQAIAWPIDQNRQPRSDIKNAVRSDTADVVSGIIDHRTPHKLGPHLILRDSNENMRQLRGGRFRTKPSVTQEASYVLRRCGVSATGARPARNLLRRPLNAR